MSKSFFDWELGFRKKGISNRILKTELDNINSIGISEKVYRDFLKEWKKKNLEELLG